MSKHQREYKEVKTRPLLQKIENLEIDNIELQEEYDTLFKNLQKTVQMLQETTNFSTGKLKYDSNKLCELLNKIYDFKSDI